MAFVSSFYGGTPDYWMDAPIRMVFTMYREGIKMEARQYRELAWIALTPRMNLDYFNGRIERYDRVIDPEIAAIPPRPGGPVIDAGSEEARISLKTVAVNMRRFMGYGGR